MTGLFRPLLPALGAGLLLAAGVTSTRAEDLKTPEPGDLQSQNQRLQQQVQQQQRQIDELRQRLDTLEKNSAAARPMPAEAPTRSLPAANESPDRQIRISGEADFVYFKSGADGQYPNSEFRVDDAKIFIEAKVWRNAYLFGGLELVTREAGDENFHVGEFYADIEQVASIGRDAVLNLRAGRFNIPFGEEYQFRNALDNPLISHSVADLWGVDAGVQLYGSLGRLSYNLAVQNGGINAMRDFNSDKAVTARLSFDATPQLHLSASAMRTGTLDVANDGFSALWVGNGFFRALGLPATTTTFAARLAELDAHWHWKTGHLAAATGWIDFDDNSTAADNSRHLDYYSLEAGQQLAGGLSAAARFSEIRAPRGYALVGQGNAGAYFYNPFAPLTTDLRRLSAGLRYQFGPPLALKVEYSWETRRLKNGTDRDDANLLSTELALRF